MDGTKNPSARVARALLLTATGAVALFNGTTLSPFFDSVAYILYLASRGYPLVNPVRLFYVTPLAIAAITPAYRPPSTSASAASKRVRSSPLASGWWPRCC